MSDKIKDLVKRFFGNLKCSVSEINGILKIENIPEKFSKFYGKPEPYYFYFNKNQKYSEGEYVTKGSYVLSCINKFLENKGETTLLKITHEEKPKELIQKKFTLRNCKIGEIFTRKNFKYLERFTFLTTFQYLNKKEETIKKIFVKDGEIIEFDISNHPIEEGKKRELKKSEFKKDYEIAKNKLKENLREKIESLKNNLSKNLENEKTRIKKHHEEQLKDDKIKLEKLEKQINELENNEKNKNKIKRIKEQIKELKSSEKKEYLKKDKNFTIEQEIQKHSLNIKNKLLNTTIICYPIFEFRAYFKTSNNTKRFVPITYDYIKNKILGIKCDSCEKEINEIILCSSGHLTCRDCGSRCENCNEIICEKCSKYKCSDCGKTVCKNCIIRCPVCGKLKCKNHFRKENFEGKEICTKCGKACSQCGKFFNPKNIKKTKKGEICELCYHKQIKNNTIKNIFD